MRRARLYEFDLTDGSHLRVHPRTERWLDIFNLTTAKVTGAMWIQEATLTEPDGTRREVTIESKSVRRLRDRARKAEGQGAA